ncbi:MAG: DHH family phosphoesterase [Bacillota bacterium]
MMNRLLSEVEKAKSIAILSHIPPDGDALGSMLGMKEALAGLGKTQTRVFSAEIPDTYLFMPGIGDIETVWDNTAFDLAIIVDCADVRLTGGFLPVYQSAGKTASLDHHLSNTGNGRLSFIDTNASSAAQVVLSFIEFAGVELTPSMATNLYVGMSADTGHFCHSNTTERTFRDAAKLTGAGADVSYAAMQLYKRRSLLKTRLIGRAISNLELLEGGKIALMLIDDPDYAFLGSSDLDYEGVIDFARDIDGVEVAVLMRKANQNKYKVSLRSKLSANVNTVAQQFGGGGHERASGCILKGSQIEARDMLLQEIKKVL